MTQVKTPLWQGRKIVKDDDGHDLEQRAGVYEFKHRMARGDAEHRAHHEYRQDKHREAAAYHLQGLKAAQAAGSQDEGHKHGLMYQLHMKALGLDPMGPVPNEIQSLAEKQDKFYKFRPHRGDVFLLQDEQGVAKTEPDLEIDLDKGDVVKFPGNPAPAVDQGQDAQVKGIDDPSGHDHHINAGVEFHRRGDLQGAIRSFRSALALRPDSGIGHFNLGVAYEDAGNPQGAQASYERAVRHDPNLADAHFNLAKLHNAAGNAPKATEYLNTYRELASQGLGKGEVVNFPGNKAPAKDQGRLAEVKSVVPETPACQQCQTAAHNVIARPRPRDRMAAVLSTIIGDAPAKIFTDRHVGDAGEYRLGPQEAHRSLTTLLHARHTFKKR